MRFRRLAQCILLSVVSVLAVTSSDVQNICNVLSHETVEGALDEQTIHDSWDYMLKHGDISKYKNNTWRDYWKVVPARGTAPKVDVPGMWGGSFSSKLDLTGLRIGDGGWIGNTVWGQAIGAPQLTVVDLAVGGHTLNGSINIGGYKVQKVTLTADGALYFGDLPTATALYPGMNSGAPVLLPFGNKLKVVSGVSGMRSGWAFVNGREINAAQQRLNDYVFVSEWDNLEVTGQGVRISIQVLIWKDGYVQFLYRTMPNQASIVKLIAAQPWVGYAAAGKKYPITNLQALFQLGHKVDVWNENGMRPGWVAFNSSDEGQLEPSVSIVGEVNGRRSLDMFFCNSTAFHLIAWDYSRDIFSVGSHSKFEVEYQTPIWKDVNEVPVTSASFSPIPWAFDEWRLNNGSFVDVDGMYPQQKLDNKPTAFFGFSQNLMPNGSAVQMGLFTGAQAQLGPEVMSWAFKISAQTLVTDVTNGQYLVSQSQDIGPSTPGLLSFKRISYVNNDVRSVEMMGAPADLNPLGLKTGITVNATEDQAIPTTSLASLFESTPTLADYSFSIASVKDANGNAAPFSALIKSSNINISATAADWNGDFTVLVNVVRNKDKVTSSIAVVVHVASVNDAPKIFQGAMPMQLPNKIAMYGNQGSTPLDLTSPILVWDDETPRSALTWSTAITGATAGLMIDSPLLSSFIKHRTVRSQTISA